jgi:hypothetical protein
MQELRDKTILLISPQSWGTMFVSKHHYAIELAKKGNRVYYLNPPETDRDKHQKNIEIVFSGIENLWFINHKLWFPFNLKFHVISLFHFLMRFHIHGILKRIPYQVEFIWSFDLSNYYPFIFFGKKPFKIFHPVDEPLNKTAINSARGSDIIFSITREILQKYEGFSAPKYFINHGVSDQFLLPVKQTKKVHTPIHIGVSGNLLRDDLDRNTMLEIIRSNSGIVFDFFGSYTQSQSNIGGIEDDEVILFISFLQSLPNVILHGALKYQKLAEAIHQMDGFLICYDIKKDQSRGTNYHKIMEYLSTGKVIISNNVTTYKDEPDLIQMTESRENNTELPELFKQVIENIQDFNLPSLQQKRVDFAIANTYQNQIGRIEKILEQHAG